MDSYRLAIGDYAKSSWSMRAWLILKAAGVTFDTVQIRLDRADTRSNILRHSPSGKVPALILRDFAISDSLAIAEMIAEKFPQAGLWPRDPVLRAKARSAAAEMHSGFASLRTQLPFGIGTSDHCDRITPDTLWEIDRTFHIWRDLRATSGAVRFLCGEFGIVDAMFAPVFFRFRRFQIDIPDDLKPYEHAVLGDSAVSEWLALAHREMQVG